MGGFEVPIPVGMEPTLKYHSERICGLTPIPLKQGGEQCMLGSLTGAVSSQIVTEERKGRRVLNCETHKSSRYESRT